MRRNRQRTAALAAALLSAAAGARAAMPFDWTERWDAPGLAGWQGGGGEAALTNAAGALTIVFREQGYPRPAEAWARWELPARWTVTNVALRLRAAERSPSAARLCLGWPGGDDWYVAAPRLEPGGWLAWDVPVRYGAGWTLGPRATAALFEQAVSNALWIGVYVRRDGTTRAQTCAVDDFRVQGLQEPLWLAIAGGLEYRGEQSGRFRLAAQPHSDAFPAPAAEQDAPGPFRIAGVPSANEYRVWAYRDANGNGARDFWEAAGEWSGNPARVLFADLEGVTLILTDPCAPDGLPYWWLRQHFQIEDPAGGPEPRLGAEDTDGDGASNYAEYRAGTDPHNPLSRFEVRLEFEKPAGGEPLAVLKWLSLAGRRYAVLKAITLHEPFVPYRTGVSGEPPQNVFRDAAAFTNAGFYRIRVED